MKATDPDRHTILQKMMLNSAIPKQPPSCSGSSPIPGAPAGSGSCTLGADCTSLPSSSTLSAPYMTSGAHSYSLLHILFGGLGIVHIKQQMRNGQAIHLPCDNPAQLAVPLLSIGEACHNHWSSPRAFLVSILPHILHNQGNQWLLSLSAALLAEDSGSCRPQQHEWIMVGLLGQMPSMKLKF
ncbi:hypothetical protein XENTR_v10000347 [Xenopus tropicalis]|nr:hypothetical protein XENTR_v10000347 [Xenopus tropicalis]